jgi:hypothetical protein
MNVGLPPGGWEPNRRRQAGVMPNSCSSQSSTDGHPASACPGAIDACATDRRSGRVPGIARPAFRSSNQRRANRAVITTWITTPPRDGDADDKPARRPKRGARTLSERTQSAGDPRTRASPGERARHFALSSVRPGGTGGKGRKSSRAFVHVEATYDLGPGCRRARQLTSSTRYAMAASAPGGHRGRRRGDRRAVAR